MISFTFEKRCDPETLHGLLIGSDYRIIGVSYDSGRNQTTVMLDDLETKDPTQIVNSYVYTDPVYPNYPVLYTTAQQLVTGALNQYNSAVTSYTAALSVWNAQGASVTSGNALAKLAACENMVVATAQAIDATKEAVAALVAVVKVLARERNLSSED